MMRCFSENCNKISTHVAVMRIVFWYANMPSNTKSIMIILCCCSIVKAIYYLTHHLVDGSLPSTGNNLNKSIVIKVLMPGISILCK